ncbi:hypothetical protein J6590_040890 [Homalodisca vitripennis]|nr:hypothetical protein J6590_040890 [Homalodisca vitripennis]
MKRPARLEAGVLDSRLMNATDTSCRAAHKASHSKRKALQETTYGFKMQFLQLLLTAVYLCNKRASSCLQLSVILTPTEFKLTFFYKFSRVINLGKHSEVCGDVRFHVFKRQYW